MKLFQYKSEVAGGILMTKLSSEKAIRISRALSLLNEAAQELSAALEDGEYDLETAPDYLEDPSDFAYDIMTMVEDELEILKESSTETEDEMAATA